MYIRPDPALSRQNQNFFQPCFCNSRHFLFHFLLIQPHSMNLVTTVKPAVNTVILAVIGNVKRGKQGNGIPKMFSCLLRRFLGHFLQQSLCRRGQQRPKIFCGSAFCSQCTFYLLPGITFRLVTSPGVHDFFQNI